MIKLTNPLTLVALAGSIAMILGIFFGWADLGLDIYTGIDIATDNPINFDYPFVPWLILALGIVALILSVLPMVRQCETKVLDLVTAAVGVLGIAVLCLFMYGDGASGAIMGNGLWLSMIGSITVIIGAMACYFMLNGSCKAAEPAPAAPADEVPAEEPAAEQEEVPAEEPSADVQEEEKKEE